MNGTNTVTITIHRVVVVDRVNMGAYYVGESVKSSLQEVAAMLQSSVDDLDVIYDFYDEANTELVNVIQKFAGRTKIVTTYDDNVDHQDYDTYTINTVDNFDEDNTSATQSAMEDYLVDFILKEWTKPVPNTSTYYETKIAEDTQAIRELLCFRQKPTRTRS